VVLQWCYSGVTVVLQWCYSALTVVLPSSDQSELSLAHFEFVVALYRCVSVHPRTPTHVILMHNNCDLVTP
jgi:hypothetical protein